MVQQVKWGIFAYLRSFTTRMTRKGFSRHTVLNAMLHFAIDELKSMGELTTEVEDHACKIYWNKQRYRKETIVSALNRR